MDYKTQKLGCAFEIPQMQKANAKKDKKMKFQKTKIFLWITNHRILVLHLQSHKCKCQRSKAKFTPTNYKIYSTNWTRSLTYLNCNSIS